MKKLLGVRSKAWTAALVGLGCIAAIFTSASPLQGRAPDGVSAAAPGGHWIVPGLVYEGDGSCSAVACHGSDEAKAQSGQEIGDELTIFQSKAEQGDPHSQSWKTLASAESKAIAAKLKIDDAQKSGRCLSCHALEVSEPQRGAKFDITTGNSCESCHGPAQKWLEPHAKAGWAAAERSKLGTKGLIATHGLFDTSDLVLRAEMCVACHLQIDKDLIGADHPPLRFEMYGYNSYFFDKTYTPHWDEPKGKGITARQWAIGQAIGLASAKQQPGADELVMIYQQGADLASKHFGSSEPASLAKADVTPEKCAAAATDLAALAEGAKSEVHRKIIAFGSMALVEANFDLRKSKPGDDVWETFDVASKGVAGAEYVAAVKKIADAAR